MGIIGLISICLKLIGAAIVGALTLVGVMFIICFTTVIVKGFIDAVGKSGKKKDTPVCKMTDSDGNEITKCSICGIDISKHNFIEIETLRGERYTIQVLECKDCRTPSFGWFRKD